MATKKQQQNYRSLSILWSATSVLFIALCVFKKQLFTDEPFFWSLGIILFLLAYETTAIIIVEKKKKTVAPRQIVSLYMLLKGVKIFVFLAALIVYVLTVKVETRRFVLVAVAIYFIYLLFDTFFLISTEKRMEK
jgi:uncharacterized membrane protein